MPQLVKGGKHAYGWSTVLDNGQIRLPKEALTEYKFETPTKVILMTASKRSGGFAITTPFLLKKSKLSFLLDREPRIANFQLQEGETVRVGTKNYCWVHLNSNGTITVPKETLKKYDVNLGDQLLSVRGSSLALSFIVKGPIIAEAKKHSNLERY